MLRPFEPGNAGRADYEPFGKAILNGKERLGFIGKERDNESSLGDFGVRKYDPDLGRFLSVDALSDLMPGSSPFHYCFNNPLILRDPSGLIGEIGGDGIPRFTTGEVVCEADGPWRHWWSNIEGARRGNDWMNGQGASRMGSPTAADRVGMGGKESGHGSSSSTGVIDGIQTSLDVVGLADPTGIADGVNAIVYVLRGRWGDAAISGMGILPYVGDLGKVGRLGGKAVRTDAKVAELTYEVIHRKVLGADGGISRIIIERQGGSTISRAHQVFKDGKIIHQHQTHIGKYGGERQFPVEWSLFKTVK